MKNVLIIGSTGQIGSELTMKLRSIYNGNIVAGYIPGAEPKGELAESGPSAIVDITNEQQIAETVSKYHIDTIYNLAALLSAVAEAKPQLAWKIGMGGLFNVLEVARTMKCAVFTPSSIGVFGNNTPKDKTPQDTIRNPRTMYGVTKVSGELLSDYYNIRFGVDTRSVRFPGLISYVTPPGGGTTDYAVDIYYSAAKGEKFVCPIGKGTYMDMMYMPDALRAAIEIMEADPSKFVHRKNDDLDSTYELLAALGYEMADDEKALQDGTHQLFAVYGSGSKADTPCDKCKAAHPECDKCCKTCDDHCNAFQLCRGEDAEDV